MGNGKADASSLVVIGASAGGIEALERLVTALPESFPAPVVIAQHADPKIPSHLAQILGRHTPLKIVTIDQIDEELVSGTIYLAVAGKNMVIEGTTVGSGPRKRGHPIPSIDALFISAAESFGDRVIAVILTGMGTDGVAGVRAVKERGGTVLVQEPESAAFPALPAAIPLNHIDFSANLDSLPSLLTTLAASDGLSNEIANPEVLRAFLNQLRTRSGIDFRQYKTPTLVRRLARLMAASGHTTLADYMRHLGSNPEAYQRLISTFLIKVTEFFRDPQLFAQLRNGILPDIVEHARKNRSELRLWSAGCATGEEAYSLAIALADFLGDEVDTLPIRIFATDLDADAIASARRGIYPASAFKEMPPELLAKYFTRVDDAFQVKKRIRNLTVFGEYDLGQRAPFPRIDLVLCRNVLIYFTKELQQRTLQLFAFSLRVGGYLVLGKAETTSPLPQFFTTVNPTLKIFRRQGERLLIPAPAMIEGSLSDRPAPRRISARGSVAPRRLPGNAPAPRWSLVDRLGAFLFESPIGIVVVDRNYDIITINQAARALLGVHGQGIGEDLIHLASLPSPELKAALDSAFRNEMPSRDGEIEVRDAATNETRFVQVTCYPDQTAGKDGRVEGVFVLAVDVTEGAKWRRRIEAENQESRASLDRVNAQNSELLERQRVLIDANSELTAANAELRSANEHLLIAAEEAEASAEEVETLNEEMQATSEELETLNEELQATVEELNTTNEELAARSNDLERLAKERQDQLESAQNTLATLRAVITHTPLAVCLIDERSKVALASQRYAKLAESNGDLPQVGDTWRNRPKRVEVADENGNRLSYSVRSVALPEDDGDVLLLLEPKP
ncbi:MAG: PAS domain-containing protein [Candidatus Eremiobacteraeota bacterium]|nr:PAS domain-containing protein [Candidatus Eremiobacteraeota bacterium]MBV8497643.1 PAS domain-containing protein [Candidatus Eremiobacteraeota bacterium]